MSLIKHRVLKFSDQIDFNHAEHFIDVLANQSGVTTVEYDAERGKLKFAYDLENTCLQKIEEVLVNDGFHFKKNILAKLKRNWLHYTEENELGNYQAPELPCCSHPDEILEKTKKH